MIDFIKHIVDIVVNFLIHMGPVGGILLIVLESIYPALPLFVFISLNISAFGLVLGMILSYIGTICGCLISYFAFKKFGNLFKKTNQKEKVIKMKAKMNKISLSYLAVMVAMPFTPAFLVNIAAGLSNMKFKKYFIAILIGKIPMILFWSLVGKNLKECLTDWTAIIKIVALLLGTYIISKIVNKFMKWEE